jgi:nucleoside-diphosphate-sugar epimerase
MRALVTGGAGFIGRHMTARLAAHGWEVDPVDTSLALGVRQVNALDMFRRRTSYDMVVHCAAIVGGRETIDYRPADQIVDFELDAAMFRWAARGGAAQVVYFSSSAAYPVMLQDGRSCWRNTLRETDIDPDLPDLPDSLYGWSKLTGERMADAARQSGVNVLVVRPFSGYGPDQDLCYPFPAIIDRVCRRETPVTVWGTGEQTRDFVHVDDICGAVMALLDAGQTGPFNIGTGIGTSMRELAELAVTAAGHHVPVRATGTGTQGVSYRVADISRLRPFYVPEKTIGQGVAEAVRKAASR